MAETSVFLYGTTRATNAIVEGRTARTALLVTQGFPDILVLKEGGKPNPHQLDVDYPEPYIPRRLTFEIPERIDADGEVVAPFDDAAARTVVSRLADLEIDAVAVCFLWSVVNPAHERRMGALLAELLPDVPVTLSHRLNPILREYRRASSAAIDASLKPLMQAHLRDIEAELSAAGYAGELLVATSFGGVMHVVDVMERPIYMVRSGPAMAPAAGRAHSRAEGSSGDVIVCDTGGTTFDVSILRDGAPKFTRDTWLGRHLDRSQHRPRLGRRALDRRGRRLDRLGRRRRPSARRPAQCRRRSWARLLRPRRQRGHRHRRGTLARLSRSRALPRRPDAA